MLREIKIHQINELNEHITLHSLDIKGAGNANHRYRIDLINKDDVLSTTINFQEGPINEVGFNGITNEVLLAIVIDRLQGFQAGSFACRENALALTKIEEGLHWLQARTRNRISRGVEGTNKI